MQNQETKKIILAGLVLCVLIFLGVAGYSLLSKSKQTPSVTIDNQVNQTSAPSNNTAVVTVAPPPKPVFSTKQTVDVTSQGFDPDTIVVKVGALVTWTNKSNKDVAIASDPHPTHEAYPPLNLGKFPNGNGVSLIFTKTGTYGYHNHFSPTQTGKVIVE